MDGTLERQRLLEQLQTSDKYRVAIISGPPGYGKTTLAAQFAHRTHDPVIWHSLDVYEGDVINLHQHSLTAFSSVFPEITNLKYSNRPRAEDLAGSITNFLRTGFPNRAFYVLDDVQHLVGSPGAETWLRTLVQKLPSNWRLLLLSRTLPKLPLAEMIGRHQLLALGTDDLRFTDEEINQLWDTAKNVSLADRKTLLSRLEGWPAGVTLALHPLPKEIDHLVLNGDGDPTALFYSLAQLLLESQPPDVRTFLLNSSTFSKLTPELCRRVLDLPDPATQLSDLLRRNLFLTKVAGGAVYHRLFRNFLQDYLKTHHRDRFISLHRTAATWFEETNQDEESFEHYLAGNLPNQAAAIADKRAKLYFAQGKFHSLLKWEQELSHFGVPAPALWIHCAIVSLDRYDYETAETRLQDAETQFAKTADKSGLANVQLQRALIRLYQGKYYDAIQIVQPLFQQLDTLHGERATMLFVLGVANFHLGENSIAIHYLENALPLYRQYNDAHALTVLLQSLEAAYLRSHRLQDAANAIQEVVSIRRELGAQSALALAFNNLGYHYHLRSDYHQAKAMYQEALDILSNNYDRRAEAYLMWSLGDLQRDRGGFNEAQHLYRRSLDIVGNHEPALACNVLIGLSTLYRWQGKLEESCASAEHAIELGTQHGIRIETLRASAALNGARAEIDGIESVITYLDSIVSQLRQSQDYIQLVWVLSLCIIVSLRNSEFEKATRYLQTIVELTNENGCLQPLAAEAVHNPILKAFLEQYSTRYPAISATVKQLEAATLKPDPISDTSVYTSPVYSLRVQTSGQIQVERDGQRLTPTDWQTTKARDLFILLLLRGPRTLEIIGTDLWPESSQEQIKRNFHISLHRARQAIGQETILFQEDLYLLNSDVDIWCDIYEFEDIVRKAGFCTPNSPQAEEMWRKAADLYKGDFLPSIDVDWINLRREALREQFVEVLKNLGACTFTRGDYNDALTAYQSAASVDPYREDLRQAIFHCYAKIGQRSKIAAHYVDFEQLLRRDLAISPSDETRTLFLTLTI